MTTAWTSLSTAVGIKYDAATREEFVARMTVAVDLFVTVLKNFDIIGTANDAGADGPEAFGVEKDFPVTVDASGTVSIDFTIDGADQPQVNAIVLTPVS